jgi:predicted nucleic acid-binding protein
MSQILSDFSGTQIYLDTMVPYALLRGLDTAVQTFFAKLEEGQFHAFTSVLTFDELAYRMLLALIRDNHTGSPIEYLRQNEQKVIAELYPKIAPKLERLRHFPNLLLLDVTATDLDAMDKAINQHHLRPRDALHLAAMQKCDCLHIASKDSDFDRIPTIHRYIF